MKRKGLWAFLVCVILILGFAGIALAAWGTKELETEKAAATFAREAERGGYKVVTTAELKGWLDQKKKMLIVDTMPYDESFKKQHIPGAVNMEFPIPEMTRFDDKTKSALEKLLGPDKNLTIVFYCGFVKCTRSHNAAILAVKLGYKNVYRQPGGIKAWDEAGYPVEKAQ
ncbi:MAG TPA: rhodanese-like domain-containing protein [Syntrophales bacterium]|nr:rhodanese-like domain-containing protein [Syntrophales bacterium]